MTTPNRMLRLVGTKSLSSDNATLGGDRIGVQAENGSSQPLAVGMVSNEVANHGQDSDEQGGHGESGGLFCY